MENLIRLQKVLSDQGVASRRKAEEMIRQGQVKVNGHPAQLGQKVNPARDLITIDGQRLYIGRETHKYYIMLNKPRGYVTTMSDELGRRCVAELVEDLPERVYPIGRLDKDSEGLLLLTNDGDFANMIMHPSHHVSKTYRVTVRPDITDAQTIQLSTGVVIDGKKTSPAHITVLEKQPGRVVVQFVIYEGRNRQVRKMCEAVGLEVARLKRTAIGPLKLGMLAPGKWRELKPGEVGMLRNAVRAASGAPEVLNDLDETVLSPKAPKAAPSRDRRDAARPRPENGPRRRWEEDSRPAPKGRGPKPAPKSFGKGEGKPFGKPAGRPGKGPRSGKGPGPKGSFNRKG